MLRDITIGRYYPIDSVIHRIDPRTKIIITFLFMYSVFIVDKITTYPFILIIILFIIKLSKVPYSYVFKGLKPIFGILIFSALINLFFTSGDIIFSLGFLKITTQGIYFAISMVCRLILLMIGSSIFTYTTSSFVFAESIEYLLKPFKKIGVPAHEIAMMMSIALRYIPIIIDEIDKIIKAQQSRGADFENGNIIQKSKALVPIFIPMFIMSLKRADELALAMISRCYRGDVSRTKLKKLKYSKYDIYSYIFYCFYLSIIFILEGKVNIL